MHNVRLALGELRPHAASLEVFGDPKTAPEYAEIKASIERDGLLDPIVVTKDRRVVSGCLRLMALLELRGPEHEIWVQEREFASSAEELVHVVKTNLMRRSWSARSRAAAFRALRSSLPEHGGTKQPRGRPRKHSDSGTFSRGVKSDEAAARMLGIGKHEARALDVVYHTAGVPEDLKQAVESGAVSPTRAAEAIRQALAEGEGKIANSATLVEVATSSERAKKRTDRPPSDSLGERARGLRSTSAERSLDGDRASIVALLRSLSQIRERWSAVPTATFARVLSKAVTMDGSEEARAEGMLEELKRLEDTLRDASAVATG
jgi:hypothetical protein